MMEPKEEYDKETIHSGVKLEAVRFLRYQGISVAQAARDLGLHGELPVTRRLRFECLLEYTFPRRNFWHSVWLSALFLLISQGLIPPVDYI
jgi:hypothetical protein